jgi:large subunit ribosomal protein L24e
MKCSFCSNDLAPGTGKMYVRKDGSILYFCSMKCEKNQFKLARKPYMTKWTKQYHDEKEAIKQGRKEKAKPQTKKAAKREAKEAKA